MQRCPVQAAHVLGKLLSRLGEDRVLWGTDSVWYGPPQTQIMAFRAFEISAGFQHRYGYPALTDAVKAKKDELTAKFNELNTSMPGLVSAVQTKFDALKKTHKLPAGADDALASLKQTWSDASTSMQSGDLSAAMNKASDSG